MINHNNIIEGIKKTKWPCRLEKVNKRSILSYFENKSVEIFIDGAHNESAAINISKFLQNRIGDKYVIIGRSRETNHKDFAKHFNSICKEIIAVRVIKEPYPESQNVIYKELFDFGMSNISKQKNVFEALEHISRSASNFSITIIICGSLYLYRDIFQN